MTNENEITKITDVFSAKVLDSIEPASNPFQSDMYNMGHEQFKNLTLMYDKHSDSDATYLILVHNPSGERIEIKFPKGE